MIRDFFADLELSPNASLEDVKRAYKRLARRFHPDLNPGDIYAEESFKKIREAYEELRTETRIVKFKRKILADPARVPQVYSKWKREPHFAAPHEAFVDEWKMKSGVRPDESLDVHVMAKLDPTQRTQMVEIAQDEICSSCRGKGGSAQSVQQTCKTCAGLGYQLIRRGAFRWKKTCDTCRGRGFEILSACSSCGGYGKISKRQILHLPNPKDGEKSCYEGLGHQSFDGKKRGNLWVSWIKPK